MPRNGIYGLLTKKNKYFPGKFENIKIEATDMNKEFNEEIYLKPMPKKGKTFYMIHIETEAGDLKS